MHTVSPEVAKKLKEEGWDIETDFGYELYGERAVLYPKNVGYTIPAPALGELIRELKKQLPNLDNRNLWAKICESESPEDAAAEVLIEVDEAKGE
jgi:hypothetical protein